LSGSVDRPDATPRQRAARAELPAARSSWPVRYAQPSRRLKGTTLAAFRAAERLAGNLAAPHLLVPPTRGLPLHLLVRLGEIERAEQALDRLTETTRAAGTDWALGTEARSRALLGSNQAAEDLYREAIDRLGRTGLRIELARAHLLYGEWLRRQRRRGDARDQLRAAYEIFVSAGAGAFAERARIELRATGERAPKRTAQTRNALTTRETHIARMAGQGASNAEIAAQLYISPATVAYHLRKIFAKLGISSRKQLASALSAQPDSARPVRPQV
jgi:DNA-binding CsgD family transcriptional regulator